MACLRLDDMSYYATAQLSAVYDVVDSTFCTWSVEPGLGRTDGCIKRVSTSNQPGCGFLTVAPTVTQLGTWSAQNTGYIGVAVNVDDVAKSSGSFGGSVLAMKGALLATYMGGTSQLCVFLNPNGSFGVWGTNRFIATSIAGVVSGQWAFIEIGWFLSQSASGWCIIRVNGNTVLNFSGRTACINADIFPFAAPPPTYNSMNILGMSSEAAGPLLTFRACDLYVFDGQGTYNNTFLGDVSIGHILTDAPGDETNWTPLSAPNWSQVNAVPPVGDASYVETLPVGTRDAYNWEDIIGDPAAIQVSTYARKVTTAAAALSIITRQGGVDYDGPVQGLGSVTYDYIHQPYDTNPATGLPYTEAEMNAGQWGPLKAT